jgi:hypothetical protein
VRRTGFVPDLLNRPCHKPADQARAMNPTKNPSSRPLATRLDSQVLDKCKKRLSLYDKRVREAKKGTAVE